MNRDFNIFFLPAIYMSIYLGFVKLEVRFSFRIRSITLRVKPVHELNGHAI